MINNTVIKLSGHVEIHAGDYRIKIDLSSLELLEGASGKLFYADGWNPKFQLVHGGRLTYLKHLVYGKPGENKCVVFINGDFTDFRKGNLREVLRKDAWVYSINPYTDTVKCIWKHRYKGFYTVRVCNVTYGSYRSKEVALVCRNEIVKDMRNEELKEPKYYKDTYKDIDAVTQLNEYQ